MLRSISERLSRECRSRFQLLTSSSAYILKDECIEFEEDIYFTLNDCFTYEDNKISKMYKENFIFGNDEIALEYSCFYRLLQYNNIETGENMILSWNNEGLIKEDYGLIETTYKVIKYRDGKPCYFEFNDREVIITLDQKCYESLAEEFMNDEEDEEGNTDDENEGEEEREDNEDEEKNENSKDEEGSDEEDEKEDNDDEKENDEHLEKGEHKVLFKFSDIKNNNVYDLSFQTRMLLKGVFIDPYIDVSGKQNFRCFIRPKPFKDSQGNPISLEKREELRNKLNDFVADHRNYPIDDLINF